MTHLADRSLSGTVAHRQLSAPELRGRAAGILVLTLFGSCWVSWGSSAGIADSLVKSMSVATIVLALALVVGAVVLFARARTAPSGESMPAGRAVGRRFGLVVLAEFAGVAILARIAVGTGRTELIPAVACAVVGVHFLPLARLFGVRLYRWTGLALCGISFLTILVASTAGIAALWTTIPGLGAALTLFVTSGLLFAGSARGTQRTTRRPL